MSDRDLILGVMATQAGFVTPAQVMEAASAVLIGKSGSSLLEQLERMGALTPERRALLESMANEALARSAAPGAPTLLETLDSAPTPREEPLPTGDGAPSLAAEREGQFSRLDEIGRGRAIRGVPCAGPLPGPGGGDQGAAPW